MAARAPQVEKTQAAIQKAVDEAEERGHFGVKVDATPDEHYTVSGVTSGKHTTPESDPATAGKRNDQHHYEGTSV